MFCYFHSSGFDQWRPWSKSSINQQSRRPLLAASVDYSGLHFEQDFLNFAEAITTAQPEINYIQGETHGSKTDD
jgi:hypothetical protein